MKNYHPGPETQVSGKSDEFGVNLAFLPAQAKLLLPQPTPRVPDVPENAGRVVCSWIEKIFTVCDCGSA